MEGRFPYIRMPVRKILAASHVTAGTEMSMRMMVAKICQRGRSGAAAMRSIMIMGVIGGMKEKTMASRPLGY
ncbi:MAG: hypothetical protein GY869_24525 [Planctomycetes bacterium]|nr:hypothetical protein [Planctomycetota bacterium]